MRIPTILTLLVLCFAANNATASGVPANLETCIKQQAPKLLFPTSKEEAWRNFVNFSHREFMGAISYKAHWRSASDEFKRFGQWEFFTYLWKNRKTNGSRSITQIRLEPRELPEHAFRGLIHVHVAVSYSDGKTQRANLLGTKDCKLVDAAWGNAWLSRQLYNTIGVIERKIIEQHKKN